MANETDDRIPMATWHKEPLKYAGQDYDQIKSDLKRGNRLFEDPKFEASNRLLVTKATRTFQSYSGKVDSASVEWLRPKEICARQKPPTEPKFLVENFNRFDVKQGELGNCWFLAALANLAENKKRFRRVVPRKQHFYAEYAGIFRFRFWKLGEWIEVVVDDRLPTRDGKLIYLRSSEPNEFWSALLEKAYAKLHGSYRALEGGTTLEAAVDFTGGIPEVMDLSLEGQHPQQVFSIMNAACKRGAFMGSSIGDAAAAVAESWGLHTGHAFTITGVFSLNDGTRLIRVRNPHGDDSEWKGEWCDKHRNWDRVSSSEKRRLEVEGGFDHDGEFFMSLDDFLSFYGDLEVCHLDPESSAASSKSVAMGHRPQVKEFERWLHRGQWRRGVSSGGCGNDGFASFADNPQYFFQLTDPDPNDDEDRCPVVVSLSQLVRRRKTELSIGFKVYKCGDENKLEEDFFKRNSPVSKTESFINARDVTKRMRLQPGRYCVVPATFSRGDQADFSLRIFIERLWGQAEADTNESKPNKPLKELIERRESLV